MNLLAAGAAFGVLTAFFQWGWGSDSFGLGKAGPVEASTLAGRALGWPRQGRA
jgi:hypothetical protein